MEYQDLLKFISPTLLWVTLTISFFEGSNVIYRKTKLFLFHPVLMSFLVIMSLLKIFGIEYTEYKSAVSILDFGLGMSVVSLGYLIYEQEEQLKKRILPVLCSTVTGCLVAIFSVVLIGLAFGMNHELINSMAPKSVTVPIAIAISEPRGGIVALTSIVVFITGILGNIFGVQVLKLFGVKDTVAQGYALGTTSHGIGTARSIELGALEGAMSGLAMALMGVATALVYPVVALYLSF